MTKKDYERIASVLHEGIEVVKEYSSTPEGIAAKLAICAIAGEIARYCEKDSKKFNKKLFLAACGVSGESVKDVRTSMRVEKRLKT